MFRVLFNSSRRLRSESIQLKSLTGKYDVDTPKLSAYHLSGSPKLAFRSYSDNSQSQDDQPVSKRRLLPPLMAFQEVIWPSVFKSFRGFIFLHFIIRPYLDGEFNVKEFTTGAKQAVHIISTKLANGDWEGLKDFVSDDILPELKESLSKMTVAQRSEVAIGKEDIYLTFPYQVFIIRHLSRSSRSTNKSPSLQIGIIFDEEEIHRRIVEITMVFHSIKGLQDILNKGEKIPMNLK